MQALRESWPVWPNGVWPRSCASATASVRSSSSRRLRATERAICATSRLCVSRVRKRSPSWFTKTWVLYSRRRKAVEWTMRSRSRWYSLLPRGGASRWRRPRERSGRAAQGARSSPGMHGACVEHVGERSTRHLARDGGLPDALQQYEVDAAAGHLLVVAHQLEVALEPEPGRIEGQARRLEDGANAAHVRSGKKTEPVRELCRQQHAGGDRLAVQPGAEAGADLDCVAKRVSEVEHYARAGFQLIARHYLGLVRAGALDGVGQRLGLAAGEPAHVGLKPFKERGVADQPVLNDLREPRSQFARGERPERVGIGNHRERLVERSDHVLAERVVDRRLAPDRGINLREQCRRHLDIGNPALKDRGGESGEIADDSAAQRDQRGAALAAVLEQRIEDAIQRLPRLMRLAVGHRDAHHAHPA